MGELRQLIVVSGLSGSGKSVALKLMEDRGFFAVDNLPATLIPALVETMKDVRGSDRRLAISIDARSVDTISALPHILGSMRSKGIDCRVLFLDATDEAITRRFAETRRPHPLAVKLDSNIGKCIAEERRLLEETAGLAHRMDTSTIGTGTLRSWVSDWIAADLPRLVLTFQSFGFKHGIPIDADFVFDVRMLPNPFYDPKLRPLNGTNPLVKGFLDSDLNVGRMIDDVCGFLMRWLPSFAHESRASVTVAVGCTGGQHRSVHVVGELASRFGSSGQVLVRHRDMV